MKLKHSYIVALSAGLLALSAMRVSAADPWGLANDVPTWQGGDTWGFTRSFKLTLGGSAGNNFGLLTDIDGLGVFISGALNFTDAYTLRVDPTTPTLVVNTGFHGFQPTLAYNRRRTAGSFNMTGTARLTVGNAAIGPDDPSKFITVNLSLLAPADSSTGTNWTGVGDLSQIREQFGAPLTSGTLFIQSPPLSDPDLCTLLPFLDPTLACGNSIPFAFAADLSILSAVGQDNVTTGAMEAIDFPTIDPFSGDNTGEQWKMLGWRGVTGSITLAVPAFDVDEALALDLGTTLTAASSFISTSTPDPVPTVYTDTRYVFSLINGLYQELNYYSPTAKEISYWKLGNITAQVNDTLTVAVEDFITRITPASVVLGPDSNFTNLVVDPERPAPGAPFTVTGNVATGTQVTGRLILPGDTGTTVTVPVASGAFTLNLTAPTAGDGSPSLQSSTERESGSFGIYLIRDGGTPPYSRKTLTVRLEPPNATTDWKIFE